MTYVIIGSGAAGLAAAEKLRELDNEAQITLLSIEDNPYFRMYLPDLLSGSMRKEKIFANAIQLFKKKNINFIPGFEAVKIDSGAKKVYSKNNEVIGYDKLLAAIGSDPFIPDVIDDSGVKYILPVNLSSVTKIKEDIVPLEKAAVIGGGLLGLQITAALLKNGLHVSLIEKEDQLLRNILTKEQSDTLIRVLVKNSTEVFSGIKAFDINEKMIKVKNDNKIWFDHLFITCGMKRINSIRFDNDASQNDIFYAGACACAESYLEAVDQGIKAAYDMIGRETNHKKIDYPVLLRALELAYMGDFNTSDEAQKIIIRQKNEYKKLVIADDLLIGFVFIGESKKARLACSYIAEKKPVLDSDLRELLG